MNKSYKFGSTETFGSTTTVDKETMDKLLCKGSKPQSTEITMKVSDIKTITEEDLKTEIPKEEYDNLLLKVYWFLKGINHEEPSYAVNDILHEIERVIGND